MLKQSRGAGDGAEVKEKLTEISEGPDKSRGNVVQD